MGALIAQNNRGSLVPSTGFNAQSAAGTNGIITQQDFQPQIATANQGVQGNIANQNAFASALLNQMNGTGPNLANAQLANATGQNVSNQAALMAGERGTGSNAGLIARQAAQQGAGIQQQASGQAAVNRAQQQLSAEGQLGGVYGQIGTEQGQNLATQQQAQANQNSAIVGSTNAANTINAQVATNNTNNQMAALQGIGQAAEMGAFADGGEVHGYSSDLDPHLDSVSKIYHPHMSKTRAKASPITFAKGGSVKALVSPEEKILTPDKVNQVAKGKANPMEIGSTVPGKPKVPGAVNSYENDTVPAKLPVNSIVIPRSATKSKDPVKDSMRFVQATLAKKRNAGK